MEKFSIKFIICILDYLNLYDKGGVGQKSSKCDYVIWE